MEQLTKRQRIMLVNGLDALDNDLGKDGGFWNDETDGPRPSPSEIRELIGLLKDASTDGEPEDDTPMKNGKPYVTDPDRVMNAMLLTDAGMTAEKPLGPHNEDLLEQAIAGWSDDERAAAFEWAALSHLKAGDNDDVVVPPCPPHVQKIRPVYGKPAAT